MTLSELDLWYAGMLHIFISVSPSAGESVGIVKPDF